MMVTAAPAVASLRYDSSKVNGSVNEVLTVAQIESRFESEWVLVEEPRTNEALEVQSGRVLWHSKDREEVYRKAVQVRPKRFAILYTGTMPQGTEIAL
jgi:endo-1,4-beta-mannosidase